MSWLRNHKNFLYRLAVGAAAISLTCFIWTCVRLYRDRKLLETEIAARNHGNQTEAQKDGIESFSGDVVEYNGKQYRRNSYVKAILCIGVDRSGNMTEKTTAGFGGQADGLFLIAQDTARNTIKILMIPRDTMTDIMLTDLSGNELGKDLQHLNLAYAYGDGREKSCEYMV
ncbi:MAG: LytR family transcriptional regulator, partial [Clostridia bacterium]|nr:LytR family transcriptional regulator [Clostridia bacterium]